MDDKEFYKQIMAIHSKLDTLIAKAVTSEVCKNNMEHCRKDQDTKLKEIDEKIKPIERFQYKLLGAFALGIILIKFI